MMKQRSAVLVTAVLSLWIAGAAAVSLHADTHNAPSSALTDSPGAPKPLAPADQERLLNDKFKVSYSSKAIPKPVQALYASPDAAGGKAKFPMAEPGKPWNDSDDVRDQSLPFRRLIFSAVSLDYCVVYYEHGGIMYNRIISLFHLHGKKAELVWSGSLSTQQGTFKDIRDAIRAKNYRDGGRL